MTVTRFALLGAAGYIAPRHMEAIRDVGGSLVAACDPHDSVGVLDRFAPGCEYFQHVERFDRHLEFLHRGGSPVDYVSICTPSWLHDAHCRLALRAGAHAICEKPLVLRPHNLDALEDLERETGRRVYPILQLRHWRKLADVRAAVAGARRQVTFTYVTPRGPWYARSWKGQPDQSGGILYNIGIHLFDVMLQLFGEHRETQLRSLYRDWAHGVSQFAGAEVAWKLSTMGGASATRCMRWDNHEVHFDGFTSLHTEAYRAILAGNGLSIADVRPSLELVDSLRRQVEAFR